MSYVEGLKIHVESAELKERLEERVGFHSEKADQYARRYTADKELLEEEQQAASYSNSARKHLADSEKSHRNKAAAFKFMADHLVDGVTYVLDQADLAAIEITVQGW